MSLAIKAGLRSGLPRALRRMGARPSWALAPLGAAVALVLLLGTVTLGLRLRSAGRPEALPDAAPLDYGAAPFGAFSPLSPSFISDVLGGVIGLPGRTLTAALPGRGGPVVAPTTAFRRIEVVHALTNDDRSRARPIPSVPFTARTDTRRATRESGEPSDCGALGGGSVWYRFTAPTDVGLIANTFGSSYATSLGVFAGGAEPTNVGCDTDVQGNAIVQFVARKGTTYFFQIAGPAGGGDLVFSLDPDGVTTLDSVSRTRKPADASARRASLSGDARFVAFESEATNLVRGPDNRQNDIFVRDRKRGTIVVASVDSSGRPSDGWSGAAFMSGNGRYVAFESDATNLVDRDTNGSQDVFVHDLRTRRTERVSVSSSGAQGREEIPTGLVSSGDFSSPMSFASMSFDGRYVAFQSRAYNLVPRDRNQTWDVFVHDRVKRVTERVSVSSSGTERGPDTEPVRPTPAGNGSWMTPSISGNGRFVSFRTSADNLVKGDDDRAPNAFVHDRLTRTTERIDRATTAPEVHASQALSFDGRYVAFTGDPSPGSDAPKLNALVHDRVTGRTVRVDVSSSGKKAEDASITHQAAISSDGRYVTFHSNASNLVPGDDNGNFDVFVHDLRTRTTVRVANRIGPTTETGRAICQSPAPTVCGSSLPSISADGSAVAFESAVGPPPVGVSPTDQAQIYVNERPAAAA